MHVEDESEIERHPWHVEKAEQAGTAEKRPHRAEILNRSPRLGTTGNALAHPGAEGERAKLEILERA